MVLTSQQTRRAEEIAVEHGMSWLRLMENAGSAAIREIRNRFSLAGKKVVVVCGKGNNGGDGYVIARKLIDDKANIKIIATDPASTFSAKEMLSKVKNLGLKPIYFNDYKKLCIQYLNDADIIIDAIFGTGFKGEVVGFYDEIISAINNTKSEKIAIDIPSGLISDTGFLNNNFVRADLTITFIAYKPCHLLYPSNSFCGKVVVTDIGIPNESKENLEPTINVVTNNFVVDNLPERHVNFHKGLAGTAGLFVGSVGMSGAAIISAKSAILSGVGVANVILPKDIYSIVATSLPEAICTLYDTDGKINLNSTKIIIESLNNSTAGLIGCGIGNNKHSKHTVKEVLKECNIPLVIDADGINVLEGCIDLIKEYKNSIVLTPHPKEAARLLSTTTEQVQNDRLGSVKKLAELTNAVCVLKGANTLIATPNNKCYVVTDGNPGMATAGCGDMLAGMIVAFIAQGLSAETATLISVKLHALSGDSALKATSILSLTPTDMLKELPSLLSNLYYRK